MWIRLGLEWKQFDQFVSYFPYIMKLLLSFLIPISFVIFHSWVLIFSYKYLLGLCIYRLKNTQIDSFLWYWIFHMGSTKGLPWGTEKIVFWDPCEGHWFWGEKHQDPWELEQQNVDRWFLSSLLLSFLPPSLPLSHERHKHRETRLCGDMVCWEKLWARIQGVWFLVPVVPLVNSVIFSKYCGPQFPSQEKKKGQLGGLFGPFHLPQTVILRKGK